MWQVSAGGQEHESQQLGNEDEDGDNGSLRDDVEDVKDDNVEGGKDEPTGSGNVDGKVAKAKAPCRRNSSKQNNDSPREGGYFEGPGQLHALTRGALVMWNSSSSAVDVPDSTYHAERLSLAKKAVESLNILGLRGEATKFFDFFFKFMHGDYMRTNLADFAKHADQVNILVLAIRYNPCTRQI
jgi:hypothetical protein